MIRLLVNEFADVPTTIGTTHNMDIEIHIICFIQFSDARGRNV